MRKPGREVGALVREQPALQLEAELLLHERALPAPVEGDQRKKAVVAGQAAVAHDDVEKEPPGAMIVLHARLPALARKEVAQEPVEVARQAFDDVVGALGHD